MIWGRRSEYVTISIRTRTGLSFCLRGVAQTAARLLRAGLSPGLVFSSEELWKWIDAHETELGIGRPYLDRDPPHVVPLDGKEYAAKRGRPTVRKAGL